jgi:hypothetical protein
MQDTVIATYSRSRLREPDVLTTASRGPVEITSGRDAEPLVLLPLSMFHARAAVSALTELYLRVVAAIRVPGTPRVLLGDAAFISGWDSESQQRFVDGFTEALAESVRTGNPEPARFFVEVNERAARRPTSTSPSFTGEVSDDAAASLEGRFTGRR